MIKKILILIAFLIIKKAFACVGPVNLNSENFNSCGSETWTDIGGDGDVAGDDAWTCGSGVASMNGYGGTTDEDWLISPSINMDTYVGETITFDFNDNYSGPALELWYSSNYTGTGDPNDATWTLLYTCTTGGGNANVDISSITGENVYFAFKYTATGTGPGDAAYWEVDNISIDGCTSICSTPTNVTDYTGDAQYNQVSLSWSHASCYEEYLIVVKESGSVTETPTGDGSLYTNNTNFGDGTNLGSTNYTTYEGSSSSTTITGLTGGTNYCFMIYTRAGSLWSSGVETCITPLDASSISYVNGTLVNSCGGSAEGLSEMVTIQVGSSSLNWNDISITFPNGGTYCNSCAQTWATNSDYVNDFLETDCPSEDLIFEIGVDGDVVPAGARIVIFTGNPPDYDYDFSTLCGSGPIYVMFADNSSTTGRFANSANADRTLSYTIAGYSSSVTYYSSSANTGTDGDFVSYDINGNPTYLNSCTPEQIIVLSNNNLVLSASKIENNIFLTWKTDVQNPKYSIERSEDGINFVQLEETNANDFVDYNPEIKNYYRIIAYGETSKTYSNIEKVDFSHQNIVDNIYPNPAQEYLMIDLAKEGDFQLTLYAIDGKEIIKKTFSTDYKLDLSSVQKGIYFLNVTNSITNYFTKVVVK